MRVHITFRGILLALAMVCNAACDGGSTGTVVSPEIAGQQLYAEHGCGICHGPDGRGDGPIAETLDPPPRNFHVASEFRFGGTAEEIALTLDRGFEVGVAMPSYSHLSEAERTQIALYIVSLRSPATAGEGGAL